MVNLTGYMPGNEIAVRTTEMLGSFYDKNPNHKTSIDQLPVLTEWASYRCSAKSVTSKITTIYRICRSIS
jgi:hypothetical protein